MHLPHALTARPLAAVLAVAGSLAVCGAAVAGESPHPGAAPRGGRLSETEATCLAKVVMHEAGNQPRIGQIAVARVVMNRIASGRFPGTVCAVVNQPGQFFRTAAYLPSTRSLQWKVARAVADEAQEIGNAKVVQGALYFAAKWAAGDWNGRRVKLAQIGGHVFYR